MQPGVPEAISRYRIERLLGAGGMGRVYLAEDPNLHRRIALKVLAPESAADPEIRRRFCQEAFAASAISHPNVAQIYEIGEEGGAPYIAMEYVEGESLAARLQAGPLPPAKITSIGIEVAGALEEAHARGVVHRDIKPANLVIDRRESIKVLDFGVAKLQQEVGGDEPTRVRTATGRVIGTVDYMSPEQALGRDVDGRSDLFSLGCVLYEMTTGRRPFRGQSVTETLSKVIHDDPEPIGRFSDDAPPELIRIIRKCLEKDRERRYQSARDLLIDLRNLERDDASTAPTAVIAPAPTAASPRRTHWLIGGAVLLAVVAGAFILWSQRRDATIPAAPTIRSLAVLPLEEIGRDEADEYFADGLTELLVTELAKVPSLRVISRTSVLSYAPQNKRLPEIARDLGVEGIVQGTVQRVGGRVRITARLMHGPTDSHLWAHSFESGLDDLFGLQTQIARAVVTHIEGNLSPRHAARLDARPAVNAEASQSYLRGRFEWNKRTPESMKNALELYREALQVDPSFALAHAGIANYYSVLPFYSSVAPRESFPQAKEAALKALQLDPSLAEAHASLGYIRLYYDWDWTGAEKEFRRARELQPSFADLHHWYSRFLTTMGRHEEALAELEKAHKLDPLSRVLPANKGMILYFARRYDEALGQLQTALELDPAFPVAHWGLGLCYVVQGKFDDSLASLEKAIEISPRSINTLASLGHVYALAGRKEKAQEILAQMDEQSKLRYVSAYHFALIHVGLGNHDDAIRWLEKAYDERSTLLTYVGMDPRFDPLRSDPRLGSILDRAGVPQGPTLRKRGAA
ncbi:MAG TPA: protein kinase [Thermoanaerobaculia bacterium]|nr:protein kinase [Thermoanaerobaculia bacterium]